MRKKDIEHFVSKKAGMAVNRYNMISAGDSVAVGVSGGKDSLSLLRILNERKRWLPVDYNIKAVHISTDYETNSEETKSVLRGYFEHMGYDYVFKDIVVAKSNKKSSQDCFWCAWNRRKALFETARDLGIKKVALGHHKDDLAETILMNLMFNGEISGFNPVQPLFGGKIVLIRPLVFLEEEEIAKYAVCADLPVIESRCPKIRESKRAVMKKLIFELARAEKQDIKSNIVRALGRIRTDYLGDYADDAAGGDE